MNKKRLSELWERDSEEKDNIIENLKQKLI